MYESPKEQVEKAKVELNGIETKIADISLSSEEFTNELEELKEALHKVQLEKIDIEDAYQRQSDDLYSLRAELISLRAAFNSISSGFKSLQVIHIFYFIFTFSAFFSLLFFHYLTCIYHRILY